MFLAESLVSVAQKTKGHFDDLDILPKKIKQGLKLKRDTGPPKVHLKVLMLSCLSCRPGFV